MAISMVEEPEKQKARECAIEALKLAEEYGIVKKNPDK